MSIINHQKVRKLREAEGMTLMALSNRIGVSEPQLSYFERGLKQFSVAKLKAIADVFGVTIDELLTSEDSDTKAG